MKGNFNLFGNRLTEVENQILTILANTPYSTALEVKDQLLSRYGKEIFKSKINSILYGSLKNEVSKDASYRWYITDPAKLGLSNSESQEKFIEEVTTATGAEVIGQYTELENQILQALHVNGELTALQLKEKLLETHGVCIFKSKIDSILTGSLKGPVEFDHLYRYKLTDFVLKENSVQLVDNEKTTIGWGNESTPHDKVNFQALLNSNKPHYLISDTRYNQWTEAISQSTCKEIKIGDIAKDLNLPVSQEYRDKQISDYLHLNLVDIFEMPDPDFRRTLLLCFADIAMNRLCASTPIKLSEEVGTQENSDTLEPANIVYWALNNNEARDAYYSQSMSVIEQLSSPKAVPVCDDSTASCGSNIHNGLDVPSFQSLLAADKPHYLISETLYNQWIEDIKGSCYRNCSISEHATTMSLPCQAMDRGRVISDYLDMTLADVFEMSDHELRRSLLLCLADIAINKLGSSENAVCQDAQTGTIADTGPYRECETVQGDGCPTLAELMASDFPVSLVSTETLDRWRTLAKKSDYKHCHISDIADDLKLSYQGLQYDHRIVKYVEITLHDLYKMADQHFSRTLLLCLAYIAENSLEGNPRRDKAPTNLAAAPMGIPQKTNNAHPEFNGGEGSADAMASSIIARFKEGRDSAIGISKKAQVSPLEIVKLLQKRGYISNLDPTSGYDIDDIPQSLLDALASSGLTFELWCSSLCVIQVVARRAIKQLIKGEIITSKSLKVVHCLKQDFPEVYAQLTLPSPATGEGKNANDLVKILADGKKAEKLFIQEGKGIVTIAKELGLTAMSVFSLLVQAKAIKRKSSYSQYIRKIPSVLREQLKNEGLTFGVWCNSINVNPEVAEKIIASHMAGKDISESGEVVIDRLKEEFPETYNSLLISQGPEQHCVKRSTEVPPRSSKTILSFKKTPTSDKDDFLQRLKLSSKPDQLITDTMWSSWTTALTVMGFESRLIGTQAKNLGLFWPESRESERFDKYFSLRISEIRNSETPAVKRAVIISTACAAQKLLQGDFYGSQDDETPEVQVQPASTPEHHHIIGTDDLTIKAFLRKIKLVMNPENLISDEMWSNWVAALTEAGFGSRLISAEANRSNLHWPGSKREEQYDRYLGLSIANIRHLLGADVKRTLIVSMALAVQNVLTKDEFFGSSRELNAGTEKPPSDRPTVPFEEIFCLDDPIERISAPIWENWKAMLEEHHSRYTRFADLVDELGSLYWQARWSREIVADYLSYNIEDLKAISFPGKARTIVNCFAKLVSNINQEHGAAGTGQLARSQTPSLTPDQTDDIVITKPTVAPWRQNAGPTNPSPAGRNMPSRVDTPVPDESPKQAPTSKNVSLIDEILDDYF